MKKSTLLLFVGLLAFFAAGAASAPTYTAGPDTLWRLQTDPTFNADATLATCNVTAFYKATFTNTTDPADHFEKQLGSVNVDCVKDAAKPVTYTFDGKSYTLTYGAIAAGMAAAAAQEWAAAPPGK